MAQFKVGDVVVLNSGSPDATVVHVNENGTQVNVLFWSERLQDFIEGTFNTNTIRKISK